MVGLNYVPHDPFTQGHPAEGVFLVRADRREPSFARQYLPKRTDLKPHSQTHLDAIALELNARPRKTLEFMTPSQKFTEVLR